MADEFGRFVVGSWEAKGKAKIAFPITRITQLYGNRLAKRRRPYKDGWKLDDTGSDGVTWELESIFHNGHDEPGLPLVLYPAHLDKICDSFVIHETGTLTTPTRGPRRARLETFRRVEDAGLRDAGTLTMTFLEDNEDGLSAASFSPPSAKAVARTLARDTTDALAGAGAWSDLVSSVNEAAAGLEALANAPGDFVDDLDAQANAMIDAVDRVEGAFTSAASEVAEEATKLLLDPENSRAGRLLRKLGDTAARTKAAVGAGRTRGKTYPRQVSIFDVARDVQQSVSALMAVNAGIPDLMRIPPRTPIQIFEAA